MLTAAQNIFCNNHVICQLIFLYNYLINCKIQMFLLACKVDKDELWQIIHTSSNLIEDTRSSKHPKSVSKIYFFVLHSFLT